MPASFNRMRGEDSWIGCRVKKGFWSGKGRNLKKNYYTGTVTAFDDDEENPGHRLFEVRYDDGDVAWVDAGEVYEILVDKQEVSSTKYNLILLNIMFATIGRRKW